ARHTRAETRSKYYVVLREPATELVEAMCALAGLAPMPTLDPAEVYIVGLDLDATGISDVKLYMRLALPKLPRTIRNFGEVRPLAEGARSVALQQCLAPGARRQLHFHARDVRRYDAWLEARAEKSPAIEALCAHA